MNHKYRFLGAQLKVMFLYVNVMIEKINLKDQPKLKDQLHVWWFQRVWKMCSDQIVEEKDHFPREKWVILFEKLCADFRQKNEHVTNFISMCQTENGKRHRQNDLGKIRSHLKIHKVRDPRWFKPWPFKDPLVGGHFTLQPLNYPKQATRVLTFPTLFFGSVNHIYVNRIYRSRLGLCKQLLWSNDHKLSLKIREEILVSRNQGWFLFRYPPYPLRAVILCLAFCIFTFSPLLPSFCCCFVTSKSAEIPKVFAGNPNVLQIFQISEVKTWNMCHHPVNLV